MSATLSESTKTRLTLADVEAGLEIEIVGDGDEQLRITVRDSRITSVSMVVARTEWAALERAVRRL